MSNDRSRRQVVLSGVAGGVAIVAGCATESADNNEFNEDLEDSNEDLEDRGYTKLVTDERGVARIPPCCWPLESILVRDPDFEDKDIFFDEDEDIDTPIEIELTPIESPEK